MQILDGSLVHSASDLNAFSECLHLVALERRRASGQIERPVRNDATAELLARKGDDHERHYLELLRRRYGDALVAFEERPAASRAGYEAAQAESIAAMERGAAIIYQATFFDGTFVGRADFLRRVARPSVRWPWSYEVIDTKLALSPKPYFLIQLCNYSEHLERIAGTSPEHAHIVLGSGAERTFRVAEYAAYYRRLKAAYLDGIARGDDAYPFACAHCELCAWRAICERKRDLDDHLSLVAGIRRDQIVKLETARIETLAALATAADEARPKRLSDDTFTNLRAQAGEQHRYRRTVATGARAAHSYRFRPLTDPAAGFGRLPQPDPGDVFFDMEGDPMYRPDRALEYLFGVYLPAEQTYVPFWGTTPELERDAFRRFVDFVVARREHYPGLHVYHYAPYEITALKRLMGRYALRENEIDGLLRAQIFVDLYPIVKQSIWISQPSYSIKKLEALYGFVRTTITRAGDDSIVMFESWLESHDDATLEDIRAYNEDDCRSTFVLREWLLQLRAERIAAFGEPIPWRSDPLVLAAPSAPERTELQRQLLDGLPEPDSLAALHAAGERVRARWLLGHLLEFHRREQKPAWWEFFDRLDNTGDLVDDDRQALGGLHRLDVTPYKNGERDRTLVHTFGFPEQEHDVGNSPVDRATGKSAGTIVSLDDRTGTVKVKLAATSDPQRLRALIPGRPIDDGKKRAAIETIARMYLDGTLPAEHPATFDLLLARTPRLTDRPHGARLQPDRLTNEAVSATVAALDRSYLVIQGPPGTGKSTTGAQVIVDLLRDGKRVALAAQSHKALHALLHKVEATAAARGHVFRGCHKSSSSTTGSAFVSQLAAACVFDTPAFDGTASAQLVSATTFGWAEPAARGAFDVVIVDEAGQISLADALVTSLVAANVVLLGDPQQLPHVSQGLHPIGTGRSILEHLVEDDVTVRTDRGIFLETSYRMQPAIERFVSDAFYSGRLRADALTANNRIEAGDVVLSGTFALAVPHEESVRKSVAEAAAIVEAIVALLAGGTVTIRDRAARPMTPRDILVVAPYNVQRVEITRQLEARGLEAVGVGTVDKFQGQEAPVVFYSLTTSNAESAPRGLDFLLNPNRLNVALSRAQAATVLVYSPSLPASAGRSIEQMRLLNLLCSFIEHAVPMPLMTADARHSRQTHEIR